MVINLAKPVLFFLCGLGGSAIRIFETPRFEDAKKNLDRIYKINWIFDPIRLGSILNILDIPVNFSLCDLRAFVVQ